jgi:hypothetical protein
MSLGDGVVSEVARQVTVRVDLSLRFDDPLFNGGNRVGASNDAQRWGWLFGDRDQRGGSIATK